jgi:hypothetical protein
MGLQPQEQVAKKMVLQFVQLATKAGLSTVLFVRPTPVLVRMGLQPEEQVAKKMLLQFVHVATKVGIPTVLFVRRTHATAHMENQPRDRIALLMGVNSVQNVVITLI